MHIVAHFEDVLISSSSYIGIDPGREYHFKNARTRVPRNG